MSKQKLGTNEAEMTILDSLLKFIFFLSRRGAANPLSFFVQATRDDLGKRR